MTLRDGAVEIMLMICEELVEAPGQFEEPNLFHYELLHSEGKNLIRGWFRRAVADHHRRPSAVFEPFIYAWFSFNAWAACVTGYDADWKWRKALSISQEISSRFDEFRSHPGGDAVEEFSALWPIFKAQEIRRRGLDPSFSRLADRQKVVGYYLAEKIGEYAPKCWIGHNDAGDEVPTDWPHTLAALYRVRCNLFHGEKAPHSEMDQRIVVGALRVLVGFLDFSGLLG